VTDIDVGPKVIIGDVPLRVRDVVAVARGAPVELSTGAINRIRRSREHIEEKLAAEEPTYGLNRGLGHNKDRKISIDELTQFSLQMLRAHEGGLGPPLPADIVRAAILTRVSGIAQGGSGASPALPETLSAMLNSIVTPVVPSIGSVGAGDLGQMASIGLVAIGEGMADYRGERMAGADALHMAGIDPFVIGPKDGLTVMSANGISVGHGALVAARTQRAAELADLVAALSLEAVGGNISVVDAAIGAAKPFQGQIDAADHIRMLLEGSYLQSHTFESVQEALSFRVVPQVHGTLREVLTFVINAVETELNAAADNPLVSADGRIVHNGNFAPLVMAVAFDALRVALAHVGQLSERRMSHLWDAIFKSPGFFASPRQFYGIKLRYTAAARFTELKQLAAPATLDVPPLDIGVEDHGTGAPLSVSHTDTAVDVLEDILIIELLMARDLLSGREETVQLGSGTSGLLDDVEAVCAGLDPAAPSAEVHAALREKLSAPLYRTQGESIRSGITIIREQ
jgi:histidine ammonia-lyase